MIQNQKTGHLGITSPAKGAISAGNGFLCASVSLWFMNYRFLG
jgi:hypothetical protein